MAKAFRIRTKLIIIQSITAFTAVVVCSIIFVLNAISTFKESAINNKYSIAQIVGTNLAPSLVFNDAESANKLLSNLSANQSVLNALLLDNKHAVFSKYDRKEFEGGFESAPCFRQ